MDIVDREHGHFGVSGRQRCSFLQGLGELDWSIDERTVDALIACRLLSEVQGISAVDSNSTIKVFVRVGLV